jgi:hypothetical protein
VGSLIAAYMLRYGWGWSFVVPGAFIAACGEPQNSTEHTRCMSRMPCPSVPASAAADSPADCTYEDVPVMKPSLLATATLHAP